MVLAELHFVKNFLIALAAIMGLAFGCNELAMIFRTSAHFTPVISQIVSMLTMLLLLVIAVYLCALLYLRRFASRQMRNAASLEAESLSAVPAKSNEARIAPMLLSIFGIAVMSFVTVSEAWDAHVMHHPLSGLFFLSLCGTVYMVLVEIVGVYRAKHGPALSPFTQQRLTQMAAASALATREQRRTAMRPLHRRGIVRIGLLLAGVIAQIVLMPLAGVGWAMLIGIGGMLLIFLLLRKLIGL